MPSKIFKRPGKTGNSWTVRFPTGEVNDKGKPIFHCKTFPLKRQASAYLETLEDARKTGGAVVESEQTLTSFFDDYLESTDIRERTREDYKKHFNRYIKPKLGSTKLKDLNPRKVQSLYNHLKKKKLAPRTVRLTHSILRSACEHAESLKLIRVNPAQGVKLPRKEHTEMHFLHGEELTEFMEQIKSSKYADLFIFMLATGTRPGEARAVRWSDLDLKKGTVRIRRSISGERPWTFAEPKTSKGKRVIALPEPVVEMLGDHKTTQDKQRKKLDDDWTDLGLVFTDWRGDALDRRNLNAKHLKPTLKRVADKLHENDEEAHKRVCGCNLYSLRHTHATRLIEAGVNLKTISERLGHKDVATTLEFYAHHTAAMEQEAVEKISEALFG